MLARHSEAGVNKMLKLKPNAKTINCLNMHHICKRLKPQKLCHVCKTLKPEIFKIFSIFKMLKPKLISYCCHFANHKHAC